jgi:diguanylate cyclase (GGDEF)-like protein
VSTLIPFPRDRVRRPVGVPSADRPEPAPEPQTPIARTSRTRQLAALALVGVLLAAALAITAPPWGDGSREADLKLLRGIDRALAAAQAVDTNLFAVEIDALAQPGDAGSSIDVQPAEITALARSLRDAPSSADARAHAVARLDAVRSTLEARLVGAPAPPSVGRMLLASGLVVLTALALAATAVFRLAAERRRRAEAECVLKRALAEAQALAEGHRRLGEFGGMLQSCRCIGEAMMLLRAAASGMLGAASGAIYLLRDDGETLERTGGFGAPSPLAVPDFRIDACHALHGNQAYPGPDASAAACCPHHAGTGGESRLCIPLAAQTGLIGVLSVESARTLEPESRRLALAIGEKLSLALANIALQESVRLQSLRDPLTGAYNRRYLEESLPRELARAARRGRPLSLLAIDIDHFKRINDGFGHDAGDAVLSRFAALMAARSREEDIVCRTGGEEFLLIMPEADLATAARRADQLREAVRGIRFEFDGRVLPQITVSVGVAQWSGVGRDGSALKTAADRALYAAKRDGRDRVVAASE